MKRYAIYFDEARRDPHNGNGVEFCSLVSCETMPCHHGDHVFSLSGDEELALVNVLEGIVDIRHVGI